MCKTHRRNCKMYRISTRTIESGSKRKKIPSVLNKNPGLNCLKLIRDVYCGINEILLQTNFIPLDIINMKFAFITSIEVECSLNRYKSVSRPNYKTFNFDNLSMYMIFHCNQDLK